jgi:hypothetical protein
MNTTAKVAAAVASGYLLGRTKKLKLAITVGGLLAGKRIATDPRAIVQQLADVVEQNPELSRLSDQVRGKLVTAGREAAVAAASNRLNRVSDSIRDRTDRMLSVGNGQDEGGTADEERPRRRRRPGRRAGESRRPRGSRDEARRPRRSRDEDSAGDGDDRGSDRSARSSGSSDGRARRSTSDEGSNGDASAERSSRSSAGGGSRRTSKRTAARAESGNGSGSSGRTSAPVKKTASKSTSPARKSAAKKTTAKKTAAKKSAAKKSTSRSAGGSSARKRG